MAGQYVCPSGHTWASKDGTPGVCPECGDAGTVLPAPTLGPAIDRPAVQPTSVFGEQESQLINVADCPAIPGHEILGMLGHGGMGVVYKARQVGLGRVVAVKMIQSGRGAGEEPRRRFRTEAEAVARLQHPNIVQIYEVGDCGGHPYFSLEYVAGGSLARRIAASLPPPSQAASLVETLALAVHYAHQRGIVHRDLKPANILLSSDGLSREKTSGHASVGEQSGGEQGDTIVHRSEPLGVPKIADFGLAKQLDDDSAQTRSGAVDGHAELHGPRAGGWTDSGDRPV
jgi:serine/threonine protein kinase